MILAASLSAVDGESFDRTRRLVLWLSLIITFIFLCSFVNSILLESQGDYDFCQRMAAHVSQAADLPAICRKFPTVFSDYHRHKSSNDPMSIAFDGMPSGSQIQARRSRSMGFEHRAKLHRRMTGSAEAYHYQPQAAR